MPKKKASNKEKCQAYKSEGRLMRNKAHKLARRWKGYKDPTKALNGIKDKQLRDMVDKLL